MTGTEKTRYWITIIKDETNSKIDQFILIQESQHILN